MTFQAEDEIAAITSSNRAAYAGALAITTTSGPGMALKTEAMGLAVAVEILCGFATFSAAARQQGCQPKRSSRPAASAFWRNSEAPIPYWGVDSGRLLLGGHRSEPDCRQVYGACHHSFHGYLANGAEPWRIPS